MNALFINFDHVQLLGGTAVHSSAPRSARQAALRLIEGESRRHRRALPVTPIAAPSGAFHRSF